MWSLIRHDDWLIVTGVWDLPPDISHDNMPDVPLMNLEVLLNGSWSAVKRAGRSGGTGAAGLVGVYIYEADGEGEDYRFIPAV